MFPYDPALLKVVQSVPNSVAEVLAMMQNIEAICADGDGLKWFNWLYLQVTTAVEARIAAGGFADPAWLAELDVQFARFYFGALESVPFRWKRAGLLEDIVRESQPGARGSHSVCPRRHQCPH